MKRPGALRFAVAASLTVSVVALERSAPRVCEDAPTPGTLLRAPALTALYVRQAREDVAAPPPMPRVDVVFLGTVTRVEPSPHVDASQLEAIRGDRRRFGDARVARDIFEIAHAQVSASFLR